MMNIRMGVHRALVAMVAAALAVGLAGCTPPATSPSTQPPSTQPPSTSTNSPSGTPSTPIAAPTYDPKGTALQNLAYFNAIGRTKIGNHPSIQGKAIVDDLVAAGFDKKAMEITPDKTSIGLAAWNIEFSVKINGTCLIGQAGNVGFNSFAAPLLASGKCLVGTTRKIDW
jgi:hypothetical protein